MTAKRLKNIIINLISETIRKKGCHRMKYNDRKRVFRYFFAFKREKFASKKEKK